MSNYTQKDFLEDMRAEYQKNLAITEAKNSDYANDNDPFQNFRVCEAMGIPTEAGFIVRMTDKLTRASNLISRENKVSDEKIGDTLSDLANYATIMKVYLEHNGR